MSVRQRVLAAFAALTISAAGVLAIKDREGLRYPAYPDPATRAAPYTICYGHTGPEVRLGMVADQAQCDLWLAQDIAVAERYLRKYVRVPLRQGQWDAYTSFVFNVGPENFRTSTMLRLLNAGDWVGSCKQFPRWSYANKMRMEGLVTRRYGEQTQCLNSYGPYVYVPHH